MVILMENKFDISMFVDVLTTQQALCNLVNRFVKRRKEMKMTQKKLADKTGVSYASIRRFETCGEIALTSLIRLADALGYLDDFERLFEDEAMLKLGDLSYE